MIKNFKEQQNTLTWNNYTLPLNGATYVVDKDYIYLFASDKSSIRVYDEDATLCGILQGNESLQIKSLVNHPRFGICVIVRMKYDPIHWNAVYMAFDGNEFKIVDTLN